MSIFAEATRHYRVIWQDLGEMKKGIMSAEATDPEEAFRELQRKHPQKGIVAVKPYDPDNE